MFDYFGLQDEIHERDRFSDFLLIILRDCLPRFPNLRLILMSAALNMNLFSNYFQGCPVLHGMYYMLVNNLLQEISFTARSEYYSRHVKSLVVVHILNILLQSLESCSRCRNSSWRTCWSWLTTANKTRSKRAETRWREVSHVAN